MAVASSSVFTVSWNEMDISVKKDDITSSDADVIAVPVGKRFSFHCGAARLVSHEAGREFKRSVKHFLESPVFGTSMRNDLAVFAGGKLQAKKVIGVVCPDRLNLKLAYRNAFRKADQEKATSVCMTGLGTGNLGISAEYSALRAMDAIDECISSPNGNVLTNVKKIIFVDINQQTVDDFVDALRKFALCHSGAVFKRDGVQINLTEPDLNILSSSSTVATIDKYINVCAALPNGNDNSDGGEVCAVCLDGYINGEVGNPVVELKKCKHVFHRICLERSFANLQAQCPLCKMWYGAPHGNQPRGGTMQVSLHKGEISGYPNARGYYMIVYNIPGGVQTKEHPHPGVRFPGTCRVAYLPNTPEGTKVLELFKVAFESRLMFTVGDSVTTGAKDVVVWNCIHNKTSLTGGASNFGYPDDSYLERVTEELASVGITEELLADLGSHGED